MIAIPNTYDVCNRLSIALTTADLLDRVLFRLASSDTDDKLEKSLASFVCPVLLKLASPHDVVRSKVRAVASVFFCY